MGFSSVRFCAISDTHSKHRGIKLPTEGYDVLLHAGDSTWRGELEIIQDLNDWFEEEVPSTVHGVLISGNHDFCFQDGRRKAAIEAVSSWTYLQDSEVNIGGIRIWGTPWTPRFHDWAFNADRGHDIRKHWGKIPEGVDVILVHGPPHGCGDVAVRTNDHVGCHDLRFRVRDLNPQVLVCGHIHEGRGEYRLRDTRVLNVSTLDVRYEQVQDPVLFEVTPKSQHEG